MLATPYHAAMHPTDMMSAWSWEEAAAQEWAAAAASGAATWASSEQVRMEMELERLQQRMSVDLEQWKYLKYQVEAQSHAGAGYDGYSELSGWPSNNDMAIPAGLLPEGLLGEDRADSDDGEDDAIVSPLASPPPAPAKAGSTFSALPPPKRVPLGSEQPAAAATKVPRSKANKMPSPREDRGEADASPAAPDPLGVPPGLLLPPGLTFARAASLPVGADEGAGDRTTSSAASSRTRNPSGSPASAAGSSCKVDMLGPMTEVSPGVLVGLTQVSGESGTRAEWRIDSVRSKLQASMGRPLVSPPFAARGLPNLRLMVFPDAREAVRSARSRERKGMYAAMVKKGPLHGSLKLKADCLERSSAVLRFHLTVGGVRRGPFTYDFSECAIHGCDDFGTDWLKQVDEQTGNLSVGVEILDEVEPFNLQVCAPLETSSSPAEEPVPCDRQEQGSGDATVGRHGRGKRVSQPRLRGC